MKFTPYQATAATLLVCCAVTGAGADDSKLVSFPPGIAISVSVKLLPAVGKVGRDNPFYDNYRPQVQFSGERERVSCAVRVPQAIEKVEPGQTAEVTLVRGERVRVIEDRRTFAAFEGGRLVAEGRSSRPLVTGRLAQVPRLRVSPNPSLESGLSTAGRLAREALTVYPALRGPSVLPRPAAQLER